MQNSAWKLTALAGVIGLGFLIVLQAQKNMGEGKTRNICGSQSCITAYTLPEHTFSNITLSSGKETRLYHSSLIDDEERSRLNFKLKNKILDGSIDSERVNMLEVNNICDSGLELYDALHLKKRKQVL